jgi:hypothetical protein
MDTAIWRKLPMELVRQVQDYHWNPYYEALMKEFTEEVKQDRRPEVLALREGVWRLIYLGTIAERTTRRDIYGVLEQYGIPIPRRHRLSKRNLITKIRDTRLFAKRLM